MNGLRSLTRVYASLLLVASLFFVVGFTWRDVNAAGYSGESVRMALMGLPDRMGMLLEKPEIGQGELPVRATYQATLNTIVDRFYVPASTMETPVIPKEANPRLVDTQQLTYMAVRGILASLQDPYTSFMDPEDYRKMREENDGNFVGIGAQLGQRQNGQIYVVEPLPDTPAMRAGVRKQDTILKVDGKSIAGMEIDEVVKMIRGPENTKVTLELGRSGEEKPVVITIVRQVVEFRMVKYQMLDEAQKIGYVRLYQFNQKADAQLDLALGELESKGMEALILDLRSNPGGLLESAVDISSRFIKSGPVVVIQERGGERKRIDSDPARHNHGIYPLVVLVNEQSASASEIVAGAIKDTDAGTLVGVKTFGKGRVQTIVPLPGDSAVRITTAKYLTPNLTDIHQKGIEPHIEVKLPEEDLNAAASDDSSAEDDLLANDSQLKKALDVMREKMAGRFKLPAQAKR